MRTDSLHRESRSGAVKACQMCEPCDTDQIENTKLSAFKGQRLSAYFLGKMICT